MYPKSIKLAFILCSITSFAYQEPAMFLSSIEKQSDSLYFNDTIYGTQEDRTEIISNYLQLLGATQDTTSQDYRRISVKVHAAKALFYEYENKYDSVEYHSKKALNEFELLNSKDLLLKGFILKHYAKALGRNDDWRRALLMAQETSATFKDTLAVNHTFVNEADFYIGWVHGQLGNYDEQIFYFKKSVDNHIQFNGEYTREAALNEHHLANVYGFMGYYRKELESYKKVIKRWEGINTEDKSYLNIAYTSLCTWYLLHGDLEMAESYALKSKRLVQNSMNNLRYWFNETYKGRTQIALWRLYGSLALEKGDTIKAMEFNDRALNYLNTLDINDPRSNPHNLPYFKDFINLSYMISLRKKAKLIKNKSPEAAISLLEDVLKRERKGEVPTVTLNDKITILEYYASIKSMDVAREKLNAYKIVAQKQNSVYVMMHLLAQEAHLYALERDYEKMNNSYAKVFRYMQKDTTQRIKLNELSFDACKPFGDNNVLNIYLTASKDYLKWFKSENQLPTLRTAHNLSKLSSQVFSENFSYLPYNDKSYATVSQINENLLGTAFELQSKVNLQSVLENIEQTSSRLSWKKFLASKQRKYLNVPDSILQRESELRSKVHFYKKRQFTDTDSSGDRLNWYKEKLFDIQFEIEQLEQWYKENYPNYFNETQDVFTIETVIDELNSKQVIIKYIVSEQSIFLFEIVCIFLNCVIRSKVQLNN